MLRLSKGSRVFMSMLVGGVVLLFLLVFCVGGYVGLRRDYRQLEILLEECQKEQGFIRGIRPVVERRGVDSDLLDGDPVVYNARTNVMRFVDDTVGPPVGSNLGLFVSPDGSRRYQWFLSYLCVERWMDLDSVSHCGHAVVFIEKQVVFRDSLICEVGTCDPPVGAIEKVEAHDGLWGIYWVLPVPDSWVESFWCATCSVWFKRSLPVELEVAE